MTSDFRLPRSTPEQQGISSASIIKFLDVISENNWEVHGFMLSRHGYVVAEGWWDPYRSDIPHALYSMSKSLISTAIGFAVAEGRISLDDRIIDLFPEDAPVTPSENLSAMRVRHLLMMATGHAEAVATWACEDGNWVKQFLTTPIELVPGTHFVYNTAATYMLCAIINRVSGQPIDAYLDTRLFIPLGLIKAKWDKCPRGVVYPGMSTSLTSEDAAKFGQLYLQRGQWNGVQLLPESWIDEATSYHVSTGDPVHNDFTQGYGYQFWRCRHNTYRADGAYGQVCLVMPEQDAVITLFSGTDEKEAVVNAIWGTLLPGMSYEMLDPNEAAASELTERLDELRIEVDLRESASQAEPVIQDRIYMIEPNRERIETISLRFEAHEATLTIRNNFGEQRAQLGRGWWQMSSLAVSDPGEGSAMKVAGSFIWLDERTLAIHLAFVETSFRRLFTCRFSAHSHEIELELASNLYWDWLPQEAARTTGIWNENGVDSNGILHH